MNQMRLFGGFTKGLNTNQKDYIYMQTCCLGNLSQKKIFCSVIANVNMWVTIQFFRSVMVQTNFYATDLYSLQP